MLVQHCNYITTLVEREPRNSSALRDVDRETFSDDAASVFEGMEGFNLSFSDRLRIRNFSAGHVENRGLGQAAKFCIGDASNTTTAIVFRFAGVFCEDRTEQTAGSTQPALPPPDPNLQICTNLRADQVKNERAAFNLLGEYPGTNAVIAGCGGMTAIASDGTSAGQDIATFLGCAAIGCMFAGFGNCLDVTERWIRLGVEGQEIAQEMERREC